MERAINRNPAMIKRFPFIILKRLLTGSAMKFKADTTNANRTKKTAKRARPINSVYAW